MVVVHIDRIGPVLPTAKPFSHGYLKCGEPFGIIIISIDLFTVEQTVDVHTIQVKSEFIVLFLDDGEIKFGIKSRV